MVETQDRIVWGRRSWMTGCGRVSSGQMWECVCVWSCSWQMVWGNVRQGVTEATPLRQDVHVHTHTNTHGQHCWAGWLSCSVTQGKMLIRFFVHSFIATEHHISHESAMLPLSSHILCFFCNSYCKLYLLLNLSMAWVCIRKPGKTTDDDDEEIDMARARTKIILFRPRVHSSLCSLSATS